MQLLPAIENIQWINLGCLLWLLLCWLGYARFARHKAKRVVCLASLMHKLRLAWMQEVMYREVRVADTSIIANLERNVSFMASTSIFVLAGLVTALASTDEVFRVLSSLHVTSVTTPGELQFKFVVLISIFVYAFFTFTWSLRQFGFCCVIIGATPLLERNAGSEEISSAYARHSGKVVDQAAHSYNFGLRAYYYAMATLTWFIHPLLFVVAVALVVWVLYQREFKSSTLGALAEVQQNLGKPCQANSD